MDMNKLQNMPNEKSKVQNGVLINCYLCNREDRERIYTDICSDMHRIYGRLHRKGETATTNHCLRRKGQRAGTQRWETALTVMSFCTSEF